MAAAADDHGVVFVPEARRLPEHPRFGVIRREGEAEQAKSHGLAGKPQKNRGLEKEPREPADSSRSTSVHIIIHAMIHCQPYGTFFHCVKPMAGRTV
ncbi:MAG TPA: hypothetical protein VLW45_00390 [Pelomicrobium sp.]|nr:hypothetical protein [Pelomicrobium sp.]